MTGTHPAGSREPAATGAGVRGPLAPIALFVHRRLGHAQRTLEALANNDGALNSDLMVFSDGPRTDAELGDVTAVRRHLRTVVGFRSVTVVERDQNLGLANSITAGVTQVLRERDRVIVMEDDLVTSRFFLRFMNEALDYYEADERVASIHGYVYPVEQPLPETFFLRGADCWGWACWRRSWRLFNPDGHHLISELRRRGLTREFDLDGSYKYTRMLKDQIAGANDSWAIRWHASAFLQDKLTLYPGRSLVHNVGNDLSGRHGIDTRIYDVELAPTPIHVGGVAVEESRAGRAAFIQFMRRRGSRRSPRRLLAHLLRRLRGSA